MILQNAQLKHPISFLTSLQQLPGKQGLQTSVHTETENMSESLILAFFLAPWTCDTCIREKRAEWCDGCRSYKTALGRDEIPLISVLRVQLPCQ